MQPDKTTATLSFNCIHIHHPTLLYLWRKCSEAELQSQVARQQEDEDRLVSRAIAAVTLATTLVRRDLNQARTNVPWSVWSHTHGKQTGRLNAFVFMATWSDLYPGGCNPGLSPALGYTFPFTSSTTRLHVKLLKASGLAEKPTRVLHFQWDLNLGGRKLT